MRRNYLKLVEYSREILKTHGYFVENLWHVDDIHFICEQQGIEKLTDQEAMQVFLIANKHFDGETGLSWPLLEKALQAYQRRRTMLHDMFENKPEKNPA